MSDDSEDPVVGMYELLEAIETIIATADPEKRAALAETIDKYTESFPSDFFWAVGPQSPTLLYHLMMSIDGSCRDEALKDRPALRSRKRDH